VFHEHVSFLHVKRFDDTVSFLCAMNQDLSVSGEIVAFDVEFGKLLLQYRDLMGIAFLLGFKIFGMFLLTLS
jgi:hypothetical protein